MMTTATLTHTIHALSSQIGRLRHADQHEDAPHTPDNAAKQARRFTLATCLMNRALHRAAIGFQEEALADYDDALPLYFKHGTRLDIATCLMNRAQCLVALGRPQGALTDYDSALFLYRDQSSRSGLASCLQHRAACLGRLNRWDDAMADRIEAAQLMTPSSLPHIPGGHDDSVQRPA